VAGLFGIGLALIFGVGLRIAAVSGTLMMVLVSVAGASFARVARVVEEHGPG
jgi:thiosulfate dehydrogenase (quinone) large subunit